ncbi:MAG: hypothetical protein ACK4L8_10960 [Nitrincola lacisaponensis]|uniref:phage tail tube protein n=1 Tax=Nitrincola lacisaponensis TaxID=267850 RepID=UPI00391DF172
MSGLLLAGDVYFDRLTNTGVSTGLVGPINATQLSISTPSETVDRPSKKKASYGQVLDSVTIPQPTEITIQFDDQPAEMLAMALLGDVEAINQGAGDVTDTLITLPPAGRWAKLPHSNLSETGISATDPQDLAIAPAAYQINYATGMIAATADGALAAGGEIKLSYSYAAVSGSRILGAVRSTIRARVFLDGTNLATGKPVKCDIPLINAAPTEAVDLMASEYVSTTLGGKILLKEGETASFYLDQEG